MNHDLTSELDDARQRRWHDRQPLTCPSDDPLDEVNDEPTCTKCNRSVSVRAGEDWEQSVDVCDDCARLYSETSTGDGRIGLPAET